MSTNFQPRHCDCGDYCAWCRPEACGVQRKHYGSDQEREFDVVMKDMGIECVRPEGGRIDFFLPEFDLFVELKTYNCDRLHGQLQTVDNNSCHVLVGPSSVKAFASLLKRTRLNYRVNNGN